MMQFLLLYEPLFGNDTVITGWVVALTCYITERAPSIGKWQILTHQGAKIPKPFLMKLGMVDYARDTTPHDMTTLVGQRNVCGLGKFWATTLNIWQNCLSVME